MLHVKANNHIPKRLPATLEVRANSYVCIKRLILFLPICLLQVRN